VGGATRKGEWVSQGRLTCTRTGLRTLTTMYWLISISHPIPIRSITTSTRGVSGMGRPWRPNALPDSPALMPWQRTSPQDGAHLAQVINDTGIQVHQKYPDRFVIGVELPIRRRASP